MIQMGKVCNRKNGNFKLSGSIRSMGTEFRLLLPGPTLTRRSVVCMKLVWSEEAGIGESNDSKQIDKCLINSLAYGSLFGYGTMVVVSFQRIVVLFSYELTCVVNKKSNGKFVAIIALSIFHFPVCFPSPCCERFGILVRVPPALRRPHPPSLFSLCFSLIVYFIFFACSLDDSTLHTRENEQSSRLIKTEHQLGNQLNNFQESVHAK